jgi:adenylate cyclase
MGCVACGFKIESSFAFCPKCGARQPIACAACGQVCQPDFSFCPRCGTPLSSASPSPIRREFPPRPTATEVAQPTPAPLDTEADRRPLTVLFADLCGFTALSEKIDPEIMRALQNELFDELTQAVESYGGFVDKFVGDALLALFGAPVAHEDDPERAIHAGINMIERAARVGDRWQLRAGVPLRLHIGINTGPVVTGGFGAGGARSYSVTGDTVNTAQRLQSMADLNEILVGPLTCRLTRHVFAFESLGAQALRGKSGDVLIHRVAGVLDAPRTARGLENFGLRADMVGREAELARLLGYLDVACGGSAQSVRLIGEAGIGKTRLVSEFIEATARDRRFEGVVVRRAVCSPLGEQSYGTLAAVLRSAYGIGERDNAAKTDELLGAGLGELGFLAEDISRLKPLFMYVFGFGDPSGAMRHIEPEQLRRQILHATRTIIERRLSLNPLLLILEDMHWADAASLEALRFMLDRLERSRLMMLTTCRPTLESDALDSNRTSLTVLRLAPLSHEDGKALIAALFRGSSDLPAAMRKRILERAGGNPLFVEEIVRGLIEMGALGFDGERWRVAATDAGTEIPMSLQAMLLARVDRLPPEVRRLAQEASVIGPRFDEDLLGAVAADPGSLVNRLDFLCQAEIIEEATGASANALPTYHFTHTLLHDVIYQNLLLQRRKELHGRVGNAMERLCGATPDRLEDLAQMGHHFCRATQIRKGAGYLMAAGDLARKTYANDDAMRLYRQALSAFPEQSDRPPEYLALCERLADLCGPAGQRDAAREHYGAALAAHRVGGNRSASARILRKLGRLDLDAGRRDLADAAYGEAAALLDGIDEPIELAHLLQERGHLAFRMGDQGVAAKWADEALICLRGVDSDTTSAIGLEAARAGAEALNTKGVALARLGRHREAVQEVEKSLAVAEEADLLSAACRAYSNLGVLYTIIDPQHAIEICRRGLEAAMRIGDLGFQARLFANLAVASCTFTDNCSTEGVPAAEKAIEIDRALDQRDHLAVPLIVLGQIHQCHGEPALARKYYEEALELAREIGEPQLLFPCYDGLATLNLERDDMDEAERYFALAQDVCARHQLDPGALVVLPFLD